MYYFNSAGSIFMKMWSEVVKRAVHRVVKRHVWTKGLTPSPDWLSRPIRNTNVKRIRDQFETNLKQCGALIGRHQPRRSRYLKSQGARPFASAELFQIQQGTELLPSLVFNLFLFTDSCTPPHSLPTKYRNLLKAKRTHTFCTICNTLKDEVHYFLRLLLGADLLDYGSLLIFLELIYIQKWKRK